MTLHLPTNIKDLLAAGQRAGSQASDAAFYIGRETDSEATQTNDVADGRKKLTFVEQELAKFNFGLQLLNALQFAREGKWQEAYAQIEATTEFSRGNAELMQAWSLVKCQVDFMRVEADGPQQEG